MATPYVGPKVILYYEAAPDDEIELERQWPQADVIAIEGPLQRGSRIPEDARQADVLCVGVRSHVNWGALEQLPHLRLVVVRSTSTGMVDVDACDDRQVMVCNVPHVGEATVAEHTFGLLLALSRRLLLPYTLPAIAGLDPWELMRGWDLEGKTLGVIGLGHIGMRVARIALAFGMFVLAYDPAPDTARAEALGLKIAPASGGPTDQGTIGLASQLADVLSHADIVTLHVPFMQETRHLLSREALAQLKPGAVVINSARGELVDLRALRDGLTSGRIGGACLDVFEGDEAITQDAQAAAVPGSHRRELLDTYADLVRRPNVVVSPHNALNSAEAFQRIRSAMLDVVNSFYDGTPRNVVDIHAR